ncbi:MAG: hypothetical protein AAGA57_02265 [Planctomycetota bacterium]
MTANPLSSIPSLGPSAGPTQAAAQGKFKPVDPIKLIRANLKLLVLAAAIGFFAGAASFVILLIKDPGYTSGSQLAILANDDTREIDNTIVKSQDEDVEGLTAIEKNILESEALSLDVVQDRNVRSTGWYEQFNGVPEAAAKDLRENVISVGIERKSAIIRVSATTRNPKDAQLILSRFLEIYRTQRITADTEQTRIQLRSFDNSIANAVDAQRAAELELTRFIQQHNIRGQDSRLTEAGIELQQVSEDLADYRAALTSSEEAAQSLADKFAAGLGTPGPDKRFEYRQDPGIQNLDSQVRALKTQIESLLARVGENHSAIKSYRDQIAAVEKVREDTILDMYEKEQQGMLEAQKSAVARFSLQVQELTNRQEDLRRQLTDYETRVKELDGLELARAEAQKNLADVRAAKERGSERLQQPKRNVTVTSPAETAERTSPGLVFTLAGPLFLFAGFTAGLTFLRELLDQRISSPAEVKMVPDANLLGVIPNADEDPSGEGEIDRVVERDPAGLLAESFRQTRTALMAKMDRRGYKTLAVCSPQPASGATTVAQNLAMSLAYNGRRVALVEANFRRPRMAGLIGLPESPGLIDVLEGRASVDDATHVLDGVSVAVIPAGDLTGARAEMLEGPGFRTLLGRLETEYDLVVIDTSPALLTAEARLLVKQVDALAIVVRAGEDKRGMLGRMIGQLDGNRADLLGVILNGVRSAAGGYFRQNYEQFYAYTRRDDDRNRDTPKRRTAKPGGRMGKIAEPQPVGAGSAMAAAAIATTTPTPTPSGNGEDISETEALAGLADIDGLDPDPGPSIGSDTDFDPGRGGRTGAEGSGFWDDDDLPDRNGDTDVH